MLPFFFFFGACVCFVTFFREILELANGMGIKRGGVHQHDDASIHDGKPHKMYVQRYSIYLTISHVTAVSYIVAGVVCGGEERTDIFVLCRLCLWFFSFLDLLLHVRKFQDRSSIYMDTQRVLISPNRAVV